MNNTRTRTLTAIVLMFIAAMLVAAAVGTLAAAATQAQTESSRSTTCITDQPCQSTVSNSTQSLSQDVFDDNED
jgi:archaellum component FlaG (FlaF/FlaG flagellin family)